MRLVKRAIKIVLPILALLSAASVALTAMGYVQGTIALSSIQLTLVDLELEAGDSPQVRIALHLDNGSSIDVALDTLNFSLYLNGTFVGSNYAPFDRRTARSGEETVMNFVVPIQPLYRPYVLQAQQEGDLAWFVRGRVKLLLAFNEKESEVWLNIREGWSDGHE